MRTAYKAYRRAVVGIGIIGGTPLKRSEKVWSVSVRGAIVACVVLGGMSAMSMPAWAAGLPTSDAPPLVNGWYQVSTAAQLEYIDQNQNNYLSSDIELMNNIDLSGDTNDWVPIGGNSYPAFSGTWNGQGHVIGSSTTQYESYSSDGFFGETKGTIENIGINLSISNSSNSPSGETGDLAGSLAGGSITDSYAIGSVYSSSLSVGGLVGQEYGGNITDSYAIGSVYGPRAAIGGLVGFYYGGSITDSYAAGSVSGNSNSYVGGFVGDYAEGSISDSFFDNQTTNQTAASGYNYSVAPGGVTGETTVAMQSQGNLAAYGWDFSNTWASSPFTNNGYPYLRVFSQPTITVGVLPDAQVGQSYSGTFSETGGQGSETWSATGLPPGLSLSSDGVWSGMPTKRGTYTIAVTVTDGLGSSSTQTYTLTVLPPALVMSSPLPDAYADVFYTQALHASGGTGSDTWSVASGSTDGLNLSTDGTIFGKPTSAGTYTFTVDVQDAAGSTASETYTLTVTSKTSVALAVYTSSLPGGQMGVDYTDTLQATGGTGSDTWSVVSGSTDGLNLSAGGTISGQPTQAGDYTFTVDVQDAAGDTASQIFTLHVAKALPVGNMPEVPFAGVLPGLGIAGLAAWAYKRRRKG